MKLVKLSVVAALAAGSFGALEAKSLEEAIKNVDVSGYAHYRFDQASVNKNADTNSGFQFLSIDSTNNPHRVRAFVTTAIDAGDGFQIVGQVMYNNDRNGGWATSTTEQGLTSTKNPIVLKQAYLQYNWADAGVSVLFGKQQLNTIWTDDFTGMAAKVLVNPVDGLTIAAFGVDSFEGNDVRGGGGDIDAAPLDNAGVYDKNMYGAAVLANFAGLDAQIWGAYWDKVATLYAANLKYTFEFGGNHNVGAKVTYLGNAVDSDLKKKNLGTIDVFGVNNGQLGNGNLIDGRLFAKFGGFDARVGGIFFGNKSRVNINTLEDTTGADLYIGKDMFYVQNTSLVLSQGRNSFGYVGVGYTLPADVRIGVEGVFGQNVIDRALVAAATNKAKDEIKDTRYEIAADISWQVNKNLSFSGYYSYLKSSAKDAILDANSATANLDKEKQTVRVQAAYKF